MSISLATTCMRPSVHICVCARWLLVCSGRNRLTEWRACRPTGQRANRQPWVDMYRTLDMRHLSWGFRHPTTLTTILIFWIKNSHAGDILPCGVPITLWYLRLFRVRSWYRTDRQKTDERAWPVTQFRTTV